jgi:hypothetical protein
MCTASHPRTQLMFTLTSLGVLVSTQDTITKQRCATVSSLLSATVSEGTNTSTTLIASADHSLASFQALKYRHSLSYPWQG